MPSREISIPASVLGIQNEHATLKLLKLVLLQGNLITQDVDAIVNPANETLLGGGGVDGLIHDAAGPELLKECRKLGGCETGNAKITKGYNLTAENVIHAVGPVYPYHPDDKWGKLHRSYMEGDENRKREILKMYEDECAEAKRLLASTYKSVLRVARSSKLKSIAIPAISTGIFSYPKAEAAQVVHDTFYEDIQQNGQGTLEEIRFVLWEIENYDIYDKVFSE